VRQQCAVSRQLSNDDQLGSESDDFVSVEDFRGGRLALYTGLNIFRATLFRRGIQEGWSKGDVAGRKRHSPCSVPIAIGTLYVNDVNKREQTSQFSKLSTFHSPHSVELTPKEPKAESRKPQAQR
jgi:hypothetical protein